MASASPPVIDLNGNQLDFVSVCIYPTQAEVKRSAKVQLKTIGIHRVTIGGLSHSLKRDSVRVDGVGNAEILEVTVEERKVRLEGDQLGADKLALNSLNEERNAIKQCQDGLESQLVALKVISKGKNPIAAGNFQGIEQFLKFYGEKTAEYHRQLKTSEDRLKQVEGKISLAKSNLARQGRLKDTSNVHEVSVLLDAKQPGQMTMNLTYLVGNAGWTPSYEVRLNTATKGVNITYTGRICQTTGEDWPDVNLSLSTASPQLSGKLPQLPRVAVKLARKVRRDRKSRRSEEESEGEDEYDDDDDDYHTKRDGAKKYGAQVTHKGFGKRLYSYSPNEFDYESAERSAAMDHRPMQLAQTYVKGGQTAGLTTTFAIGRRTTVPSDGDVHKVVIGLIALQPKISHVAIPSETTNVYMVAKTKNSSKFPFLAGPTSIFHDNSFVATGDMTAVNPNEEFICGLGVDPAIRVRFEVDLKRTAETGLLAKVTKVINEQLISLHNTRANAIQLKLSHPVPSSDDENIKVKLVEAQAVVTEGWKYGPNVTPLINSVKIEWNLPVAAGSNAIFKIRTETEFPKGEELDYSQTYSK